MKIIEPSDADQFESELSERPDTQDPPFAIAFALMDEWNEEKNMCLN